MDRFRQQLSRLQQQYSALGPSQKMLAGALIVIMAMTLFWWSTFAGRSEMADLLPQAQSQPEIQSVVSYLDARGIAYQLAGDRIRVPSDRRYEILAGLQYEERLPASTKDAFDEMVSKSTLWDSNGRQEKMWNVYKQNMLSQIIKRMPSVQVATVLIDPSNTRGPGMTLPTASVHIQLKKGLEADEKLVRSAADLVAGAVAGMKRSNVTVVVNERPFRLKDRDADSIGFGSDDYLAAVQKHEAYYAEKLRALFLGIDNVLVSVSCRPNTQRTEIFRKDLDAKNVIHKPVSEESTTDETRTGERVSEPGVVPNGGLSISEGAAAAQGSSSTMEKSKSEFGLQVPTTETKTFDPGGSVSITSAVVRIPRSYFVQDYRSRQPDSAKEPDDAMLEPFIAAALIGSKATVKGALGLESLDAIHVESYHDLTVTRLEPVAASTSVSLLVSDYYVKEIVLGMLALVSLFMVSNVARKGAVPQPAPVQARASIATLKGDDDPLGEAGAGSPLLDAVELDPDSVRSQEMLSQVQQLVTEDPDAAATMVKRWLNR